MTHPSDISEVALTVRDLDSVAAFYRDAVGLAEIERLPDLIRLGAGGRVLLELRHDPHARYAARHEAGLYHTAFLLPSRDALGGWLGHALRRDIRLSGASHHGVSEAVYLNDPEGNGVEIYADTPRESWVWHGDRVEMPTRRLDIDALLGLRAGWDGAPDASRIGHVHLAVGDLGAAAQFFERDLGLTRTHEGPGGLWYGWNGYHHHVAGNVWHSEGAGPRDFPVTGLAGITLSGGERSAFRDPWGTLYEVR
ncbi:MAG: VOC family protein [Paracoccus sp. (in: a-proteobacteria)]|nr:VOC family protein [Paracoccus sp. (in: a-proteobacteria)]